MEWQRGAYTVSDDRWRVDREVVHATFAYLADVFVVQAHRGRGLAKWLMECIVSHRELQGLRRFLLGTRDAHGLYAQFGFAPPRNPSLWMEIHNEQVHQPTEKS